MLDDSHRFSRGSLLAFAFTALLGSCANDETIDDDPPSTDSDPLDYPAGDDEGLAGQHLGEGDVEAPGSEEFGVPVIEATCAVTVNAARELVIRALPVVNDPVRTTWTGSTATTSDGAWSFGRLMTAMAGTHDPSAFVRLWLRRWEVNQTINGQTVGARSAIRNVIDAWPKKPDGSLDLTKSPMRLLAIINRFDLRGKTDAGEGRFVFGLLDAMGNSQPFTVILEYKLPATTLADVQRWANDWHALGALALGSAEYRAQLEQITNRFAGRGANPARPNGSAIGQVRTNEIALASPWQLREFRLSTAGDLVETTVFRTPKGGVNNTSVLARWIDANQTAILDGTHNVPVSFESAPFRGAMSNNNQTVWTAPNLTSLQARHLFSLNTCNACHGKETATTSFLHVGPRAKNELAPLSGFMTGITVVDPVSHVSRTFKDISRRAATLKNFLCDPAEASADSLRTH